MKNKLRNLLVTGTTLAVASFCSSAEADNPQSYPMVCKGGGDSIMETRSLADGRTLVFFKFKRNTRAATAGLSNGSCAWLDRAISSDEPDHLKMVFDGISIGTKLQRKNGSLQYVESTYIGSGSVLQSFKKVFAAFKNGTEFQLHAYSNPARSFRTSNGRLVRRTNAILVATKIGP